jgi:hypothetical protein
VYHQRENKRSILTSNRIDDERSDDEHWFSDESEGILLFSYLCVLFYNFFLSNDACLYLVVDGCLNVQTVI